MSKLIKKIADRDLLIECAKKLQNSRFTPGIDNMSANAVVLWMEINGEKLCRDLMNGNYRPMHASGFYVAKKNGSYRRFAKLTAIDTVVQSAVISTISDICENNFSHFSHAYRPGRGVASALRQYCEFAEKNSYAAKIDPIACFDNIDHTVLENSIRQFINDDEVSELIMEFAKMPVISEGVQEKPEKGILQGSALSNMLCNIYLDLMDNYLESKNISFVRYADDTVIFSNSLTDIRKKFDAAVSFLEDVLKLKVNRNKSKIDNVFSLKYLGHRFERDSTGIITLDASVSDVAAYNAWHEMQPFNNRGRIDILSDGILRQRDYSLIFESDLQENNIPVVTVDSINIYSDVVLDSRFLQKAFENNIEVNIFNSSNKIIGRFVPNTPLRSSRTIHEQLLIYYDEKKRLSLAKKFVLSSIHNTRLVIRYYNKQNEMQVFTSALNRINRLEAQIKECESYEKLLMLEAGVRQSYYGCFDSFIKREGFVFESRTRKPPKNEVNALLSFGNTVLYNIIATDIYKSPLDIRIGFLHATCNRAESLNLDIAELFKPLIVDRTVFSLINLGSILPEHFVTTENGGVYLNADGKRIFLKAFYDKLNTTLKIKDISMSYEQIIKNEVNLLVRHFKNGDKYTPFKQVR